MSDPRITAKELTKLTREWFAHRTGSVNLRTHCFDPVDVPDTLFDAITIVEPYRSQVIEDAREWLSFPFFVGLGLEFGVEDVETVRHAAWDRTISPLRFRATWANVMNPMDPAYHVEEHHESWERVVYEDGRWKIAALWSDEARDRARKDVAQIKKFQQDS